MHGKRLLLADLQAGRRAAENLARGASERMLTHLYNPASAMAALLLRSKILGCSQSDVPLARVPYSGGIPAL